MNWKDGTPEYIDGAVFDVEMENGEVRKCRRVPTIDPCTLFYADCIHPAQNAYCNPGDIVRWKIHHT